MYARTRLLPVARLTGLLVLAGCSTQGLGPVTSRTVR